MYRWTSTPIKPSIKSACSPKISTTLKSPNGITSPLPLSLFWELDYGFSGF
jgi:hypothetical protein